jgi:hypothetical protein
MILQGSQGVTTRTALKDRESRADTGEAVEFLLIVLGVRGALGGSVLALICVYAVTTITVQGPSSLIPYGRRTDRSVEAQVVTAFICGGFKWSTQHSGQGFGR